MVSNGRPHRRRRTDRFITTSMVYWVSPNSGCRGDANNQIRKCLLLSLSVKKIESVNILTYRLRPWLLPSPPHLKYVATLPCNLLLIACFLALGPNVSQAGVATYMYTRCGGMYRNNQFIANLLEITSKIGWDLTELWPWVRFVFLAHPVYYRRPHCVIRVWHIEHYGLL